MTETERAGSTSVISSPSKSLPPSKLNFGEDDPDLALARILQEQERAYFMLSQGSGGYDGAGEGDGVRQLLWDGEGSREEADEDEGPLDDEQLALRMQLEEDQAAYRALYAGTSYGDPDQAEDGQEETETDNLTYEELQALGNVVGTVSKGLTEEVLNQLPTKSYQDLRDANGAADSDDPDRCCVCQIEYEGSDIVQLLPCCHFYHADCISTWLGMNKTCPNCGVEVEVKAAET